MTDFTKDGACSRCGNCCTHHLPLFPEEQKRIWDYIRANHIHPVCHCDPTGTEPFVDFLCPFLEYQDDKASCRIYEVRPAICRSFLCSETVNDGLPKFLQAAGITDPSAHDLDAIAETNLGQEFFPDLYIPKAGSAVVVNQWNTALWEQHAHRVYLALGHTRMDGILRLREVRDPLKKETLWLPEAALTICWNPNTACDQNVWDVLPLPTERSGS